MSSFLRILRPRFKGLMKDTERGECFVSCNAATLRRRYSDFKEINS